MSEELGKTEKWLTERVIVRGEDTIQDLLKASTGIHSILTLNGRTYITTTRSNTCVVISAKRLLGDEVTATIDIYEPSNISHVIRGETSDDGGGKGVVISLQLSPLSMVDWLYVLCELEKLGTKIITYVTPF